jgi:hypothetical protein
MEFFCPECMGSLVSTDGQQAKCSTHGGEFRILFSRAPFPLPARDPNTAARVLTEPAMCAQHPDVPASFACRDCAKPICATCAFPEVDGTQCCAECATRRANNPSAQPWLVIPAGAVCAQHPSVAATGQCKSCGGFMCGTCAFTIPGGFLVCPTCVSAPSKGLSPKRKKLLIGSYAAAVFASITLVLIVAVGAGAFGGVSGEGADQIIGMLMMVFFLGPAITGFALGISARDRRLHNSFAIWIPTVWNGIYVAIFVLLMFVGLFSK